MPTQSSKIGPIQAIIRMDEGINEILGSFCHVPLNHFRRIYGDLLLLAEGILWLGIVDYLQSVIVDLDAIWKRPHLIELILVLVDYDLSVYVVLQDSYLQLVALDLGHGEVSLGKGVL
jgi:hypothetical protein